MLKNQNKPPTYKDITLTKHSIDRAKERLGITSEKELKKLALQAKRQGISLKHLSKKKCKEQGLTNKEYTVLKERYYCVHKFNFWGLDTGN